METKEWILLLIWSGGGLGLGLLARYLLFPWLRKLASRTAWQSDDLIVTQLQRWGVAWFLAAGLYLGMKEVTLNLRYEKWLNNGVMVFFVLSFTLIIANVVAGMMRIRASGSDAVIPSSSIIGNIVKVIIFCIGILVILQSLGISVTPVLTALGVGGLAVALALQDTLSNLFAGIQIIASGNFKTGDFIQLDSGQEGFVEDITWRYTRIRTLGNTRVIIPNAKLAGIVVNNTSLVEKEVGFSVELGVSYDSDLEKVERITLEVIRKTLEEHEGGVKGVEPAVRFYAFGESSILMRAVLRATEHTAQFALRHAFIKNLMTRFREENISIPYPTRTLLKAVD